MKTENARIVSTMLGMEDHGIFTAYVQLDYGGTQQGFGGYALGENGRARSFILGMLHVTDSNSWEGLTGKHIRVEHDNHKIERIGHILKDLWFNPTEELAK